MPDRTITCSDLVRGVDHVPSRQRVGLRHRPRQRPAPLHTDEPDRRRADGHHPCAARRGPAARRRPADRAHEAFAEIGVGDGPRPSSATCHSSWGRATASCPSATRSRTARHYRDRGFLPEGLLNYLALLGWSIADDRDDLHVRRDGRGVRDRPGESQPGSVRHEEVRGDQRRRVSAAASRGPRPPAGAVPAAAGVPTCPQRTQLDARGPPRRWSRSACRVLTEAVDMLRFLFVATM